MYRTSGSAEGMKVSFSGRDIQWGRRCEVWLGLVAAYSLKVVGTTAVGASVTIGRAVILPCFSSGIFAMASLSTVRACVIFVVNFVVLEVLFVAMAILASGGISSLGFQEAPN